MDIEKIMRDMERIAHLASKHQAEDEEKYGLEVAGFLRVARANVSLAFGAMGGTEPSQALLTGLHGQLQALINTLAETQRPE